LFTLAISGKAFVCYYAIEKEFCSAGRNLELNKNNSIINDKTIF